MEMCDDMEELVTRWKVLQDCFNATFPRVQKIAHIINFRDLYTYVFSFHTVRVQLSTTEYQYRIFYFKIVPSCLFIFRNLQTRLKEAEDWLYTIESKDFGSVSEDDLTAIENDIPEKANELESSLKFLNKFCDVSSCTNNTYKFVTANCQC